MDFAIPTYQRPESMTTASFLVECGVPRERIHIFLHGEEERRAYERGQDLEGMHIHVHDGKRLLSQRNEMMRVLQKNYVQIDDDITDFYMMKPPWKYVKVKEEAIDYINKAGHFCAKNGIPMFGTSLTRNALFSKGSPPIDYNKRFHGHFLAFLRPTTRIPDWCLLSEDMYLQLTFISKGFKIARFNRLALSLHDQSPGGCTETREFCNQDDWIHEKFKDIFGEELTTKFLSLNHRRKTHKNGVKIA